MAERRGLLALATTAAAVGVGLAAQRSMVNRRRRNDPEAGERFGERRGERSHFVVRPDGAQLFVEEVGPTARKGAVFIHGSALRTDVWHYQLAGIGGHRLVFYDLRGHGASQPKGRSRYSIHTLTDDLEAVIDSAGLDEAVVVGHSVGGMIALQLCCDRPELLGDKIKGLVLCNTTYRSAYDTSIGGAAVSRIERVLRHPLDLIGTQHARIDQLRRVIKPTDQIFLAVSFAAFGPHASARQIDFTYDMLAETPGEVLFDLVRSYRDFDATDRLSEVTVPALVISGKHDRLTHPIASEYLAEHLPKARLEMFDRCGHMTMLERHREFGDLLQGFFQDVLGPAGDGDGEGG